MAYDPKAYTIATYREWAEKIMAMPLAKCFADATGKQYYLTRETADPAAPSYGSVFCIDEGRLIHLSEIQEMP